MTLQQLEYVVAVDTYRQFSRAAEACGVTQPSLSAQVQKLEDELGVPIFVRNAKVLKTTMAGEYLVKQAKEVIKASERMVETAQKVRNQATGEVHIGMIPSVAPYLMPTLVQHMRDRYPEVIIYCLEAEKTLLVEMLERGEIDMAIMSATDQIRHLLSIPLYTEHIIAFLPSGHPLLKEEELTVDMLRKEQVWGYPEMIRRVFGEEHAAAMAEFERGSLYTLVALTEANGGVLIAPQTIIDILIAERYANLRPFAAPAPQREVQLFVREDYVMEQMLNVVGTAVCNVVPEPMLDAHLQKFGIKL